MEVEERQQVTTQLCSPCAVQSSQRRIVDGVKPADGDERALCNQQLPRAQRERRADCSAD
jgi:hypothetical protein